MTITDMLVTVLETRRGEWIQTRAAYLGDLNGNVSTGTPGISWARTESGVPFKVLNRTLSETPDTKFIAGKSRLLPTIWQVVSLRDTVSNPDDNIIQIHHTQHEFPNYDTVWVNRKQLLPLTILVSDAANFKAKVYGDVLHTATGIHLMRTQEVDLSSYTVTAGARYVSFEVDDSVTITLHAGTVVASSDLLTDANIPTPDPGKYFLGYAMLQEGMTELSDSDIRVPLSLTVLATSTGFQIHDAPAITSLQNADEFGVWNSLTSSLAKITWADIYAQLLSTLPGDLITHLTYQQYVYATNTPTKPMPNGPVVNTLGALAVADDIYLWEAPEDGEFASVMLYVKDTGSAGDTTIDIKKNGTTVYTTTANRPSVNYASGTGKDETIPDVLTFVKGDIFTFHIVAVATAAANLVITPRVYGYDKVSWVTDIDGNIVTASQYLVSV